MIKLDVFIFIKSMIFAFTTMLLFGCYDRTNTVVSDVNSPSEFTYNFNNFQAPNDFMEIGEPEMVFVVGGKFTMGCTPEQGDCGSYAPIREAVVNDFYIDKYVVTQKLWREIMVGTELEAPSRFNGDDLPVEHVSWNDIVNEFIPKLNALTSKEYRLPTEAEWEFAARGGNESRGYKYSGSDDIDEIAWYLNNSNDKTQPVGTKATNELGIYDMNGNVWEWVSDLMWNNNRVVRGGAYLRPSDENIISSRTSVHQDTGYHVVGFRLALSPTPNSIKERPREIPERFNQ